MIFYFLGTQTQVRRGQVPIQNLRWGKGREREPSISMNALTGLGSIAPAQRKIAYIPAM
jgi:hypothetical protein